MQARYSAFLYIVNIILLNINLTFFPHRLVSHACYPLFKNQSDANNVCAMESRSDGRGKRHATKPCPNNFEKSNRIYQCSPPYRVSSNVSLLVKTNNVYFTQKIHSLLLLKLL